MACLVLSLSARAAEPSVGGPSGSVPDFATQIAPLLSERCLKCHHGVAARGGLSLATREDLVRGGDSGAAVDPEAVDESLLWQMIAGDDPAMPEEGPPLTPAEQSLLRAWLAAGAPWPADLVLAPPPPRETWWSFRPLVRPPVPASENTTGDAHPVDAFLAPALAAAGLAPAPEADRRTLVRRLTFDLWGLPPTPAEAEAFRADQEPGAYERLVERLLASPRYGERWARHWLDVAHYGDTHGYDKDKRRDHAWPYRDYVIRALNEDRPYGQFVLEQLAGDVLAPDDPWAVIATGFLSAGPWDFVGHVELAEGTVEKAKTRVLDRDDMVSTVMSTVTSVSAHCARCHDHPFDPIPQVDYYRLQAVFAGVDRGDRALPGGGAEAGLPEKSYAVVPVAPRPIQVLARGNVEAPQQAVGPGGLSIVSQVTIEFPPPEATDEGQRRLALARWLTDEAHPLTWRSIVNRVWHYHFGRGLVDTPNDFGQNGSRPSHPELLDWLAAEFLARGQSLKELHRLLVTSRAYRQSSGESAAGLARDGDNRLWWRMNRRRLEAEELRDAVLAASGKLDVTMGGPGFPLFDFEDDHSPRYKYVARDEPGVWRRSIYRQVVRSAPDPFFEALDCAEASTLTPVRLNTLTALQALTLWNHPFMLRQAEYLAERLPEASAEPAEQVRQLFRLTLARDPDADEAREYAALVASHGLAPACRVMFNTSEFLFVD